MKKMFFAMTVDDVALRHWSGIDSFCRLIEFFTGEDIPATFFVVPLDEDTGMPFDQVFPEYVPVIRRAHTDGFCFAQHGWKHNRFEFGIPPAMILDLPHETENKRYAEQNLARLAKEQIPVNLIPRFREGREILETALGFKINGFRSPALQTSPGMFESIALEHYAYDSSICLQETGWDYLLGHTGVAPREITRERWLAIREKSNVPILPLTCDYTWMLPEERFAVTLELAKHDYCACVASGIPFVAVSHVNPVWEGCGIRLLSELYAFARGDAERNGYELVFETLDHIAKEIE